MLLQVESKDCPFLVRYYLAVTWYCTHHKGYPSWSTGICQVHMHDCGVMTTGRILVELRRGQRNCKLQEVHIQKQYQNVDWDGLPHTRWSWRRCCRSATERIWTATCAPASAPSASPWPPTHPCRLSTPRHTHFSFLHCILHGAILLHCMLSRFA